MLSPSRILPCWPLSRLKPIGASSTGAAPPAVRDVGLTATTATSRSTSVRKSSAGRRSKTCVGRGAVLEAELDLREARGRRVLEDVVVGHHQPRRDHEAGAEPAQRELVADVDAADRAGDLGAELEERHPEQVVPALDAIQQVRPLVEGRAVDQGLCVHSAAAELHPFGAVDLEDAGPAGPDLVDLVLGRGAGRRAVCIALGRRPDDLIGNDHDGAPSCRDDEHPMLGPS